METSKISKPVLITIVVIVLAIIAAVVYFLFFNKKPPTGETDIDTSGNKINWTSDEFPLKQGSSGTKVKELQAALNILKNNNLATDGKFGAKTLAALQEGFKVDSLSEANYNTYIKPNITAINDFLAKSHPANTGGSTSPTVINSNPPANAATKGYKMGDTVYATIKCTGYTGIVDGADSMIDVVGLFNQYFNKKYKFDITKPIIFAKDQWVGIAEKLDDSGLFVQCMKTDYTRVFIPKSFLYSK